MASLTDNIGLVMRIKADSSDAVKDLNKVQAEIKNVGQAGTTASAGLTSMINPAAAAATAIAAIGVSAFAVGVKIFDLVKSTSEFGSKIFDASQKTSASVETIQALGFAAQQSGSSLDQITTSIAKFASLIGQAQLGNEKASATLKQFGITATDVDTALAQAIESISKMKTETEQNAAAQMLFKDRGGDVINTLREMNGDLPGTIQKLRDMGLVMSKEDAAAADKFGDTLGLLTMQASAVGREFALQLMPAITNAMGQISVALKNNQGTAKQWADALLDAFNGVFGGLGLLKQGFVGTLNSASYGLANNATASFNWSRAVIDAILAIFPPLLALKQLYETVGIATGSVSSGVDFAVGNINNVLDNAVKAPRSGPAPNILGGGRGGGGRGGAASSAKSDADRAAEREANAKLQVELNTLKNLQDLYNAAVERAIKNLKEFGDIDAYIKEAGDATAYFTQRLEEQRTVIEGLEDVKRASNTESENDLLTQEQIMRATRVKIGLLETEGDVKKALADEYNRIEDEAAKDVERAIKKNGERLDQERERLRIARELADIAIQKMRPGYDADGNPTTQAPGMGGGMSPTEIAAQTVALDTLRTAFEGLGQAIGQTVAAWVLYGNVGTNARKVTAQILAAVAQQAAVKAIFELAEGFARLAVGDGAGAALHFKSAAMYGAVAAVAAVTGRAIAGDSFKSQTANGGTGSTSPNQVEQNNNFGGFFNGFQERQNRMIGVITDRSNAVIGAAGEAIDRFNEKFGIASPSDVVMAGAGGASSAIFEAHTNELAKGGRGTETLARLTGQYR